VTAKVWTGRDGAMGHDWSGNVGLDEHAVRQGGVGGLVLLRGKGVQDGGINPQRAHWRSSRGSGRWRSRGNTSGGVDILIALGGDASEERAAGSFVGVTVSARRTITSRRLSRRGSTLRAWSSASRDFGVDEAAPFAVGA